MHRSFVVAFALGVMLTGAAKQSPGIAPRSCHAMTYSPAAGGVIAIGGARACGVDVLADGAVWLWNGSRWQPTATVFPSRREDALIVFDTRRKSILLYGGRHASAVYTDTWELAGGQWHRRLAAPALGPGAVEHAALGYDERRGRAVMFGGGSRDGRLFDATWEWDGKAWRHAASRISPAARVGHSLAWSPADNSVLLYGGFNATGPFRDLWKWDGSVWTRLDSAGPAYTEGPALVAGDGGPMLVGVPTQGGDGTLGVWLWREASWIRADSGDRPPVRVGQGVAYDAARKRLVLFGGSDQASGQTAGDTWEFDGRRWHVANATSR